MDGVDIRRIKTYTAYNFCDKVFSLIPKKIKNKYMKLQIYIYMELHNE